MICLNLADDDIDPAILDVVEKTLEGRALHGPARHAAIVIVVRHQLPAEIDLGGDVGDAGLALGIERIEFLVEPFLGRLAGVYATTAPLSAISQS